MNDEGSAPWVVSVFRSKRRSEPSRLRQRLRALAIFGDVILDLRDVEGDGSETEVMAVAVFGDVRMFVPADTSVELSGAAIFGDKRSVVSGRPSPDSMRVRVKGVAVFGDVRVEDSVVAS